MKRIALSVIALAMVFSYSVAGAANYNFTTSLTLGSTGPEVTALQSMLVSKGYLTMPAGVAYGYFGTLTQQAVAKLQMANGITPAAGYFGPITMAKVNTWSADGGATGGSTTGGSTSGSVTLDGGDGDFKDFDVLGSPSNKDVDEGETVDVFGFEFDADDSDLLVERVDVIASSSNNNVNKPWKVLEEISLVVDGDEIVTVDASDEDNWDEQEDDQYRIRLEDVDWKVEEGDTGKAYIAVTASDSIDSDETGDWDISLDTDGVRALNAEGIDVYEGDIDDEKTFTIGVAAEGDLDVTVRAADNEDMVVEVSEDDETEEVVLYTAELESETGDNNIEEVVVSIATTTGTTNGLSDFVTTLYLFLDGEEVGSESVNDDDAAESITFDDLDVTIDEDDAIDLVVKADINSQDDNFATTTTGVYVDGITVDFVDSNDDDQTVTDTTNGGDITFGVTGINVTLNGSPEAEVEYGQYSGDNDRGTFTISFKVTAFGEDDIYVGGEGSTDESNAGVTYTISSSTAATITKAELTSTADEGENDTFVVNSGDTETFTFVVEMTDASTSAADVAQKLTITGIKWDTDDDASPDNTYSEDMDDYKTPSKTI